MNFHDLRQTTDRVRAVPLAAVLALTGAERDLHDREKWQTAKGVLSVSGQKFFDWHHNIGGGGAIDLVIHLEGLDFKAAVAWLAQRFPDAAPSRHRDPPAEAPPHSRSLELPQRDDAKLSLVTRYLVRERGLAAEVIQRLVHGGTIYADDRGNAVFLLLGDHWRPVGAEIRGTGTRPFRGMAPGSKKDLGYFAVATVPARTIILCESAIDALSCFLLHPGSVCISTAGARRNPRWLGPLIRNAEHVCCAFDADPTGDDMARAMIAIHPQVKRLRPSRHDWNDVLRARSSTCQPGDKTPR
jgi:hypothetical protein